MRDLARRRVRAQGQSTTEVMSAAETLYGLFLGGRRRSLSAVARRRQQTVRANDRVTELQEKIADYELGLEQKRDQFASELTAIQHEAARRAADVVKKRVGLEKEDIRVHEISALWIPISPATG
jgi:hypothetical protein